MPHKTPLAHALLIAILIFPACCLAGAPFRTDDGEIVDYRNWEIDIASQYLDFRGGTAATAPHIEVNYGFAPNFHIHFIFPMVHSKAAGEQSHYGYGDTEFGIKYRFFQNATQDFLVATYPLLEIPTGDSSKGLGAGHAQIFLPLWIQKNLGDWTTYGGGGYWIHPGAEHQNFWYVGWELQRKINDYLTVGGEIFHQNASEIGDDDRTAFNLGAIINISKNHHILLSAGRDIDGPNRFMSYVAYQLTFGPGGN